MFETSVVHSRAVAAERRVSVFSASVVLHSVAAVAVIVASLRAVSFPTNMPAQRDLWRPAAIPTIPPPQGNPNGGRKPEQQKQTVQRPPQTPTQMTAPRTTPDTIPTLQPPTTASTDTGPIAGDGEGPGLVPGPVGVQDGVPHSLGDLPATPQPAAPDTLYRPGADVKAPVVLHRVMPDYPRMGIAAKKSGFVVLECIIDKNGEIRDAKVLSSTFVAFNEPALRAVNQWRFSPGTLHGRPVDTIFNLTVTFTIQ